VHGWQQSKSVASLATCKLRAAAAGRAVTLAADRMPAERSDGRARDPGMFQSRLRERPRTAYAKGGMR